MTQDKNIYKISPETAAYVMQSAFKWSALTLAVVVGTALGNGVPMARTASVSFQQGVQSGLKNCPCANKKPQVVTRLVPTPTPIKEDPEKKDEVKDEAGRGQQTL